MYISPIGSFYPYHIFHQFGSSEPVSFRIRGRRSRLPRTQKSIAKQKEKREMEAGHVRNEANVVCVASTIEYVLTEEQKEISVTNLELNHI